MRLSELKTGESATILKVTGHGGFRRRIMEMGFVRGQRVEVLLNAPLKDPIEYKIMGYDISLRRTEADMVVVLSDSEVNESGRSLALWLPLWMELSAFSTSAMRRAQA